MSNKITTKDLTQEEYEMSNNFIWHLDAYADAQINGTYKERVDCRIALLQAYYRALKYQPNKDQS